MNITATFAAIRALSPSLAVSYEDGEYRVTFKHWAIRAKYPERTGRARVTTRAENIAYYTQDADDAVGTARDMLARWIATS